MLYEMFQAQDDLAGPARAMAKLVAGWIGHAPPWVQASYGARSLAAGLDVFASAGVTHSRPPFGIDTVPMGNRMAAVTERVAHRLPFGDLLHFQKDSDIAQPRLLVVAPLSGHFATLLRGTVATLLPEHDVYITDWRNARDVPLSEGPFELDDFVEHVVRFMEVLGPGSHVLAVCQPTVGVLAAVALLAKARSPAQPASMTLMAGPIDTRLNPTKVNALANSKPIKWFEENLIATVPARYAGAGRRVYPGFMQLTAFISMNMDRHVKAWTAQYDNLYAGDAEKAAVHSKFYDEYLAVMDLDAAFYLQTVRKIFQEHELPRGVMQFRGETIDLGLIRRTAMLTVEGEMDDICAIGQTMAALDLCTGVPPFMKRHHLQSGVGHYGVFNGKRWQQQIYPRVRELIQSTTVMTHA
jgi:poly(3-hydroxybutyrate) depolymerase